MLTEKQKSAIQKILELHSKPNVLSLEEAVNFIEFIVENNNYHIIPYTPNPILSPYVTYTDTNPKQEFN